MYTKSSKIDLSWLKPISEQKITGTDPMTVELDNSQMVLELTSEQDGFEWIPDQYLILDCKAQMRSRADVKIEFYQGDEMILWAGYFLIPNIRVKMAIQLDELKSKRWFLPTNPGHFKGHVIGTPTHISKIDKIRIVLEQGGKPKEFTIYSLSLSDSLPDFQVDGSPMIDEMGQCIQQDWHDKTKNVDELIEFLKNELVEAEKHPGYANPSFSQYGGWKEKRFDATGYFHTHHDGKRWWLVDPEGYAFFSNGICYGSRMGDYGFTDGMECLFEWLPPKDDALFQKAWTTADNIPEFVKRNGAEAGKSRHLFNFARANMMRAFGENWWDAWVKINASRLKQWGFNTISVCVNNFLDEDVIGYLAAAKVPFTWTLKEFPKTDTMIFRDFPDVFSIQYKQRSEVFANQLKPFVKNPYMIGYFINNEPEWLVQHNVNPAERVLASKEKLCSKDHLIVFLKNKYNDSIANLNSAWNCTFQSFDDLYTPIENADRLSEASAADLLEFRDVLIRTYGEVPANALRAINPDHLNLGMRYAKLTADDFAGAELYDVFSFNFYGRYPEERLSIAHQGIAKPVMIGEWHIGGGDKAAFDIPLVCAQNQTERGKACVYYMQNAMSDSLCVGVHYFEWNDQPALGRFDGECMQHGFIDICNRPSYEALEWIKESNLQMYEIVNGDKEPTEEKAGFIDRVYEGGL